MGDKRNFAALEWVIGEINDTLKEARQALEAYVEDPKDFTRIRFCLTHIHQVHGSLQMVEFHGASLLAEEMEQLAQALMNHAVSSEPEAQEVLMRSLLQLPTYLEHVKNHREDHPGVVLPLLNDLRAVRRQSYLSETNLFSPNLSVIKKAVGRPHPATRDKAKLAEVLKKLRQMYQFSAASVLRGIKIEENLGYLEKVCGRLEVLTQGTACYPTWEIATAMIEGLKRDDIELSVAVRGLLRHLARELRILGEKAPASLNVLPRESLIKNLLYYVARAQEGGKRIARVSKRYHLDSALLDGSVIDREGDGLSVPDPEAIRSVIVALQDEFNTIKHALDNSISGQSNLQDIKDVIPVTKRVADTLAVLGIGELRKLMQEQSVMLENLVKNNNLDDATLMDVAGKVVEIEHRLEAIAKVVGKNRDLSKVDEREIEIDHAKLTVIKECQTGLEHAKDAIVEYISSKWDKGHLENIGPLLTNIRGGLDMIPLRRPAAIIDSCSDFIREKLLESDVQPGWKQMDSLADAIASIECYLERLGDDLAHGEESLLDVAEESVLSLGYKAEIKEVAPPPAPEVPAASIEQAEQSVAEPVEDVVASEQAPPGLQDVSVSASSDVDTTESSDEEESDIDDEIIEIFIEEAGEVRETLAEYFPRWKANNGDEESLVVVRRAFHTLKGSGRMVEANDIGELAWSIENMLNRIIDRTVPISLAHAKLIDLVLDLLPSLVSAFEKRSANPNKALTEQYMAWGNELSEGKIPQGLQDGGEQAVSEGGESTPQQAVGKSEPIELDAEENEDLVLWEIFSSEAKTHIETIQAFINEMEVQAPLYSPPSDDLQRALHTLKGSAKMAQVKPIAQMAEPLEHFAKELITYQVAISEDILQLIRDAVAYTTEGLRSIEAGHEVEIPKLPQFLARASELRELSVGHLIRQKEQAKLGANKVDPGLLAIFMAEEMKLLLDARELLAELQSSSDSESIIKPLIFELTRLEEGANQANLPDMAALSAQLKRIHEQALSGNQPINDDFITVLSDGHDALLDMVDAVAAGQNVTAAPEEITSALESVALEGIKTTSLSPVEEVVDEGSEAISFDVLPETDEDETIIEVGEVLEPDQSSEPLIDFSEESLAELEAMGEQGLHFDSEDDSAIDSSAEEETREQPETPLFEPISDEDPGSLSNILSEGVDEIEKDPLLQDVHEPVPETEESDAKDLGEDDDTISDELASEFIKRAVDTSHDEMQAELSSTATAPEGGHTAEQALEDAKPESGDSVETHAAVVESESKPSSSVSGLLDTMDVNDEDYDEEIVEVFLEEATELIDELDEAIHAWEENWDDVASVEEMKRILHTFKGGARLAGLTNLGELSHDYESAIIALKRDELDEAFFASMHAYQDGLLGGVKAVEYFVREGLEYAEAGSELGSDELGEEQVSTEESSATADTDVKADEPFEEDIASVEDGEGASEEVAQELADANSDIVEQANPATDETKDSNVVPFGRPDSGKPKLPATNEGDQTEFVMPTAQGAQQSAVQPQVAVKRGGAQEVVKVSSELLEELVNLAGETSISRGRLEQQISDFAISLDEIDGTLHRLQEQLRRLDIETEAQVLFRQEQMAAHEDFDPLEMDRYSQLQQLSRSLIESASDLVDLKSTLGDKVRDTETILLQQSRINSELQEGLMRSRMVPFSRLVPRLRRIVRQVASELNKSVSFELDNVEGELDRSVLERMVPPLEHMLRNAVDHGIEGPEERIEKGKPETGRIVLTLGREGGDVILRLADDGAGIDLKRVREKAIERGLMDDKSELSDHEIMQFILHAGFSTAESVTQISGRGVGMDVVHAEIKQLGGSVTINSKWGYGTEFVVRLPFTVSVNRALMVELGHDHYAIPLNTIEGIVRVSPYELEHYYADPESRFEYAGERYQVRYMGSMLYSDTKPKLEGQALPLPVILVRSAEHTMALQVDSLMGSREIVVKSLGQQFSAVQGLSGATVMGDGSVVVILDSHALVRNEFAKATQKIATEAPPVVIEAPEEKINTIMVVDDSVTVRKVTSRFLGRRGFEVITAKDGVDALRVLQDDIPDLMLLDIEMPRMDGFEVAKNVRTTQRWKHIPIIMITSRTGDKHREHALSLGVNRYLGKPYQEDILLESINELLAEAGQQE